jgi:hypothetical protein
VSVIPTKKPLGTTHTSGWDNLKRTDQQVATLRHHRRRRSLFIGAIELDLAANYHFLTIYS